jgi:hypothetical protein
MLPHAPKTALAVVLLTSLCAGCGGGGGGGGGMQPAPNPMPALSSIAPATAIPGTGAFTLKAAGSNFSSASVLDWNGSPRATTFVSATELTAQILATDIASGGSAAVTVVTPAPGGGTSAALSFVITAVNATVQQTAPGGSASASAHYQLVATVGAPVYSSAAKSAHYTMQGGLTGAALNIP